MKNSRTGRYLPTANIDAADRETASVVDVYTRDAETATDGRTRIQVHGPTAVLASLSIFTRIAMPACNTVRLLANPAHLQTPTLPWKPTGYLADVVSAGCWRCTELVRCHYRSVMIKIDINLRGERSGGRVWEGTRMAQFKACGLCSFWLIQDGRHQAYAAADDLSLTI